MSISVMNRSHVNSAEPQPFTSCYGEKVASHHASVNGPGSNFRSQWIAGSRRYILLSELGIAMNTYDRSIATEDAPGAQNGRLRF